MQNKLRCLILLHGDFLHDFFLLVLSHGDRAAAALTLLSADTASEALQVLSCKTYVLKIQHICYSFRGDMTRTALLFRAAASLGADAAGNGVAAGGASIAAFLLLRLNSLFNLLYLYVHVFCIY
jgi:hypothetical protein